MTYRIGFTATDVDWQIEMLKLFPEIANKHFYPAMHRGGSELISAITPNIPVRTGLARGAIRKAVSGKGLNITARVGFPYGAGVAYVIPLEYGVSQHEMNTYVPSLGVTVKTHPGFPARKFMERGLQDAQSEIDMQLLTASEGVVNELAKGGR